MNESIIKVNNLDVEFKTDDQTIKALDKINLDVLKNEFICIMGISGCGKTTLLNAIAGFIEPNHGEILLRGNKIQGPGPDRAVVFQDDAVFPWMNVEDNISYSHRVTNNYNAEEKILVDKYINSPNFYFPEYFGGNELIPKFEERIRQERAEKENSEI